MKLRCQCGEILSDNTDRIPYKMRLIADEDWDKFAESCERPQGYDGRLVTEAYQCPQCHCIMWFKRGSDLYDILIPAASDKYYNALVLGAVSQFEIDQYALRREAMRVHNDAAKIIAQKVKTQGLRCPHCLEQSYETEFIDRSPTGWSFFQCPTCSRTFRLERFKEFRDEEEQG